MAGATRVLKHQLEVCLRDPSCAELAQQIAELAVSSRLRVALALGFETPSAGRESLSRTDDGVDLVTHIKSRWRVALAHKFGESISPKLLKPVETRSPAMWW